MKAASSALIVLLLLITAGCETAPPVPVKPPAVDVTGTWEGEWVGQNPGWGGSILLTLRQTVPKSLGS